MYSARLLDHFQNPRNVGELPPPAVTVEVSNPICGDILRLSVEFRDGRVAEARYKTRGCTASIAAGSALTEWLIGKTCRRSPPCAQPISRKPSAASRRNRSTRRVLAVDVVRALLRKGDTEP